MTLPKVTSILALFAASLVLGAFVPSARGQMAPGMEPAKEGAGGILGVAEIEAAACQGCGICAGECPAKAIQLAHYRDEQIIAKALAVVSEEVA